HGFRTVAVLRTVVLTLHHDAAGFVRNTNCRIGFVNVLTTGATGAVGVNTQVGRIDFHFKGVINFRVDKHTGKRGVATIGRIKGALANQAVYPGFGAQKTIGVIAFNLDGGRFDASHVPVRLFQNFRLEAFVFGIAHVHAQQHGGPVLGFGTTGAGLDIHKAVKRVGRVGEHAAKLQLFDPAGHGGAIFLDGGNGGIIIVHRSQFKQILRVFQTLVQGI